MIVVTGGTKGIGKAIIERFVREGYAAATCSRNLEDLESLKKELGDKYPEAEIYAFRADLSQKQSCVEFVSFVNGLGKEIVSLVNNTGVYIPGQVHNEEDGRLEMMIDTNLYSAYYITRGIISGMIERKDGHIFNICSTASITPYANGGSYCISKYAMLGMTKALREEMKPHGVKVTAIMPGATKTASWDGVELPEERLMKSTDVADVIWASHSLSPSACVEEILLRPQLGDISDDEL
ncbi:oxidoreductase [Fulvitalea axinellae]|uniref:Oxidoreductase n=2 Tax=Fulvitalea axinellae TaxID=1182444 RepID=A0AAU9CA50_9BACT|nr:oxidoreductase [Fulvitalea axinellae]